ncbi:MAG: family 16 glycosylhydrolase [Bacteroidia bacterium]
MRWLFFLFLVTLCTNSFGQNCDGAAVTTHESYLYGRFETEMQSASGDGIVSSFFLYNIETNCNWPQENNEIDVEMTGNDKLLYFTTHHPGTVTPPYYGENFDLGFNPHTSINKYAFEWEPGIVRWFVNDSLIYIQNDDKTKDLKYPMAINMNLWASESKSWVGNWDPKILPQQSKYNYVKYYNYTPGKGNYGSNNAYTLEWEDNFEKIDTARWNIIDYKSFGKNYCTFRKPNVKIDSSYLKLTITQPESETETINVHFALNTKQIELEPSDMVYLNGTFNNWCGTCEPMYLNDNIWQTTLNLKPGQHEYLFIINNWDQTGHAPLGSKCDFNPCDEYMNYGMIIPSGINELTLDTLCWKECTNCISTGNGAPPSISTSRKIIGIYDIYGRRTTPMPAKLMFYLYNDGTVEKRVD